jgi:peptidoglycan/xylan/chitin deacetylase (PgdA/CDA1 family)
MLHIVMYHYVRDLPRTRYPRIKGMLLNDFDQQVRALSDEFEMASIESCLEYLSGRYSPRRDLCLLTFDDGLKEHFRDVTPILADRGIQGVFSVVTSCLEEHRVVPVHMNHFLMAELDFAEYRSALMDALRECASVPDIASNIDPMLARRTYPWDDPEVASFKYFFNFVLEPGERDVAVARLFDRYISPEFEFAEELYLSWSEAREMQEAGMSIGGHTHLHRPLSSLSERELERDLKTSTELLRRNLRPQQHWPFCYPYGKSDSFSPAAVALLKQLGFDCAFTTEKGPNQPGADLFRITRVDCKNAPATEMALSFVSV